MKKIYALLMLLPLSYVAFGQFNPATNCYGSLETLLSTPARAGESLTRLSPEGVTCNQNSFWAIYGNQIYGFSLIGNTVTNNGSIGNSAGASLAFCNNLDGGSYTPTFYSNSTFSRAAYYNGTGWTTCAAHPKWGLFNAGGNLGYLYFTAHDTNTYMGVGIARYDGTAYNLVYTLPDTTRAVTVADVTVDDYGNVWFFTGSETTLITDTLNVISPSGGFIKKYPFVLNTYNAYGCFMLNGILYIGLGGSNPNHPNTLIPVTINENTVMAGDPISMPVVAYADLASCNAGSPFAINENEATPGFGVYPNPVKDILRIGFGANASASARIRIYNQLGVIVFEKQEAFPGETIDLSACPAGIYYLMLDRSCRMFIKQ